MTLLDLYNKIDGQLRICPRKGSDEVCVAIHGSGFGGTDTVDVKSAGCGIDWDNNKFIIWPEKTLKTEEPK